MVQVTILLAFVLIALLLRKEKVLLLILAILPFHFLLKAIFNVLTGGSDVISSWKEIVLITLLCRILFDFFKGRATLNSYYPFLLTGIYFFASALLLVTAPNFSDALTSFKNLTFTLVCFFIVCNIDFIKTTSVSIVRVLTISAICVFVIAHIQQYVLKTEFALFFNVADNVSANGDIVYNQTASTISGVDRMYGCFSGPNELGLYTATVLLFISIFLFEKLLSKADKILLIIGLATGAPTLIETFSRVSWFVFVAGLIIYLVFKKRQMKLVFNVLAGFVLVAIIVIVFSEDVTNIFIDSITLKESSAEGRSSIFYDGINKIVDKPFGYGLGTIQYFSANPRQWPTETFWWLVFGENGLLVGLLLFAIYVYCAFKMFKIKLINNQFTDFMPIFMIVIVLAGFGSVIIFEPIFQVYFWSFVGLGYNKSLYGANG